MKDNSKTIRSAKRKKKGNGPAYSITQILKDLEKYNKEHKTNLSYGKYVAMIGG